MTTYSQDFEDFELKEDLLRGIYSFGFQKPSPIQTKAIPVIIKGGDVIAQAQSGTGKTGTFSISILQRIDVKDPCCQALILAPTRDLAQQIKDVITALGSYMDIHVHACIGGTSVRDDMSNLRRGVHVVVGTPGRVIDMIERRALQTSGLKMLVLDEADQMLERGFKEQIYQIFQTGLPRDLQVVLCSATMPPDTLDVTTKFMQEPQTILVKKEALTLEGIKQYYVGVEKEDWKLDTLCDIYGAMTITQAIIFCNTRRRVEWLTDMMCSRDFTVSAIHGDMEQKERDSILGEFRTGTTRVLIATDVLARGIDVQQVSVVINYDLPFSRENYLHRIGRSGRYGRKGVSINFVTNNDVRLMKELEEFYSTQIDELPADLSSLSA